MNMSETTIAAISTAKAAAGISVIRISGSGALPIAEKIFHARSGAPLQTMRGYTCALGDVYADREKIDECIATVFRRPHSYTGEDVVELSCHGGMYVTARVLRAAYDAGAVPAQAGEFTKRAFLNGKMDLIEAEAVMDIISAKSRAAVRAAMRIKEGVLSHQIDEIKALLLDKAAHLNAWADYPEEDIPEVDHIALHAALTEAQRQLDSMITGYDNGRVLRDGIDTVIIGKPNVGKSTLMNLLSGYDKSIVTAVAGTTRDIVEESVSLDDLVLNLSDTAGIRDTEDEIERIGVEKARARLGAAALILCVFDASVPLSQEDRDIIASVQDIPAVAIVNKCDLPRQLNTGELKESFSHLVCLSAREREGVDELIHAIKEICQLNSIGSTDTLIYNERQRSLTINARNSVIEAIKTLNIGMTYDAVTVAIEEAITSLCELTGERVTDEVVDRVFHNFCVGK